MSQRACIITNSPSISPAAVHSHSSGAGCIIVTDGAAHRLPAGIEPHIICGDFDSLDRPEAERCFPRAQFVHNACQETNDLEKSLQIALQRGLRDVVIVGNLSGRLDQALTFFSVIERYHQQLSIVFHDGEMSFRALSNRGAEPEEYTLQVAVGDCISLIPRGDGATVSLTGVRWPLSAERLTPGSRGLSNEALSDSITLTTHAGVVYLIHGSRQP
jgi:thiamine pyrophosphokinase